jgi:hypothetical protein
MCLKFNWGENIVPTVGNIVPSMGSPQKEVESYKATSPRPKRAHSSLNVQHHFMRYDGCNLSVTFFALQPEKGLLKCFMTRVFRVYCKTFTGSLLRYSGMRLGEVALQKH